ncbi:MAG: ATP-binding protein [Planctomycetota bacterium]
MRQDSVAKFVPCAGIPMMAFGLTAILPAETVGWPIISVLLVWTVVALISCFLIPLRKHQDSIDLSGALSLAALTGGVSSTFASILPIVIVVSGARWGTRRSLVQASIASLILALSTIFSSSFQLSPEMSSSGPSLVAMAIALHGVALLSGRLKGSWSALEVQHELIVESLEEGILVIDSSDCVVRANSSACRFLGFPEDGDWYDKPISELLKRDGDEEFRNALTVPRKKPHSVNWVPRDEESRSFYVRTTEVDNGMKVTVFTDRTAELRVVETEARLIHLEELEDLSLGLAHEIRNPLASLRGAAVELAGRKLPEEQARKMEEIVRRESDRLDRTVNGFLEYSRSRKLNSPRSINVGSLIMDVIDSIEQRQDAKGIDLVQEINGDIEIFASPDELHAIINNLAINAVEACGGQGRIKFQLICRDEYSVIEVSDDGIGMTADVKARAFHPFFSTKPREGGLGLALVRKIVVSAGGWIELESDPGIGTTFRVGMPLASKFEQVEMKAGS